MNPTSQSETPRTDDLKRPAGTFDANDLVVSAKFMEQQERELGEVKRDVDNCRQIITTYADQEKDLVELFNQREQLQQVLSQAKERMAVDGTQALSLEVATLLDGLSQTASSLIVLSHTEAEKLPCSCLDTKNNFNKTGYSIKCPRCLLLERFTK